MPRKKKLKDKRCEEMYAGNKLAEKQVICECTDTGGYGNRFTRRSKASVVYKHNFWLFGSFFFFPVNNCNSDVPYD